MDRTWASWGAESPDLGVKAGLQPRVAAMQLGDLRKLSPLFTLFHLSL